jgi:hypothetical protein
MRNDSAECLILGYLDGQELACALGKRTPRPQDDAVRIGIARGDPLGIEITPLMPWDTRTSSRSDPYEPSTDCCCSLEKGSAANLQLASPQGSDANLRQEPDGLASRQRLVGVVVRLWGGK